MPKVGSKIVPSYAGKVVDADQIEETTNYKVLLASERQQIVEHEETIQTLTTENAALRALLIPPNYLSLDGTDAGIISVNGIASGILSSQP